MANWETLYEENGAALVLYAAQFVSSRALAEDVVHDSFVKLISQRRLRQHPNPRALVFQSVRWTALDYVRQEQRRRDREDQAEWFDQGEPESDKEFISLVTGLLEKLPSEQREVVVLHIWGKLSFREIGEQLEISSNTAASRYRYAMNKLKEEAGRLKEVVAHPINLTME